jgi:hypothetical protein
MKCLWKVQGHDVLPPIVKITDQDLHHSVLGPGLVVIALKNERGDANGKYCYVALKHLPKAQRFIKRAAMRKVFSRQKRTTDLGSRWRGHAYHRALLQSLLSLPPTLSPRAAVQFQASTLRGTHARFGSKATCATQLIRCPLRAQAGIRGAKATTAPVWSRGLIHLRPTDSALAILSSAARTPRPSFSASSFAQKCMKNKRGCSSSMWL